jgi:hypothetical protein
MDNKRLTEQDIIEAAKLIGVEPAAVWAIAQVEASGAGFLPDGRPKMRFESHVFSRYTEHMFDDSHPTLSTKTWQPELCKVGDAEYERYYQACELHQEAAGKAASWGMFQIMGFNYKPCGFSSLADFLLAMNTSEAEHLKAVVKLIQYNRWDQHLRLPQWEDFALKYNGIGYKKNNYHNKLALAYKQYKEANT